MAFLFSFCDKMATLGAISFLARIFPTLLHAILPPPVYVLGSNRARYLIILFADVP